MQLKEPVFSEYHLRKFFFMMSDFTTTIEQDKIERLAASDTHNVVGDVREIYLDVYGID